MLRDDFDKYKEEIEGYAGKGNRVLVFGTYDGELDGKALTGKPLVCFVIKAMQNHQPRHAEPVLFRDLLFGQRPQKGIQLLIFLLFGQPHCQPAAKLLPVNILQLSVCTKLRPNGDLIEFRKLSFFRFQ